MRFINTWELCEKSNANLAISGNQSRGRELNPVVIASNLFYFYFLNPTLALDHASSYNLISLHEACWSDRS